jgi:CHASE2 domain-containing sensor protein
MKHLLKAWFNTGPSAIFIAFWLLVSGYTCWLNEMIFCAIPNLVLGITLICFGLGKIYHEMNRGD